MGKKESKLWCLYSGIGRNFSSFVLYFWKLYEFQIVGVGISNWEGVGYLVARLGRIEWNRMPENTVVVSKAQNFATLKNLPQMKWKKLGQVEIYPKKSWLSCGTYLVDVPIGSWTDFLYQLVLILRIPPRYDIGIYDSWWSVVSHDDGEAAKLFSTGKHEKHFSFFQINAFSSLGFVLFCCVFYIFRKLVDKLFQSLFFFFSFFFKNFLGTKKVVA